MLEFRWQPLWQRAPDRGVERRMTRARCWRETFAGTVASVAGDEFGDATLSFQYRPEVVDRTFLHRTKNLQVFLDIPPQGHEEFVPTGI